MKNVCHVSQRLGLSCAFEAYSDFRCYRRLFSSFFNSLLSLAAAGAGGKYYEIME